MAMYNIEIQEVLSKTITVEADNAEEAIKFARHAYDNAEDEWVLTADNWVETELKIKL